MLSKEKNIVDKSDKNQLYSNIPTQNRQIFLSKDENIFVERRTILWANIMQIVCCPTPRLPSYLLLPDARERKENGSEKYVFSVFFLSEN